MLCKTTRTRKITEHALLLLIMIAILNSSFGHPLPVQKFRNLNQLLYTGAVDKSAVSLEKTTEHRAMTILPNRHVASYISTYIEKEGEFLAKMEQRSERLYPSIEKIFEQHGLPTQLKHLAVVESLLNPKAMSPVGARGLWQFMPVTAKELGLKITSTSDERLHIQKSTRAAARYLKDLYAQFGDWLLVLAAYNSGPGVVNNAIKKARSRNYWTLQRFLPAESRGHVKRFIAIHYYFEEQGSETTQTKAEMLAWQKQLLLADAAVTFSSAQVQE